MQYECISCQSKFHDTDQTNQEQRNGLCPSCGGEDLKVVESLLEVDCFPIDIETLADAVYNENKWREKEARMDVVDMVKNNLTVEDKKRLQLYQDKNDPCKEVE